MNKRLIAFFSILSLYLSSPLIPANAAVRAGDNCLKLNSTAKAAGMKFTCIKVGSKLVWNKGVKIAKSKSVSEPTPTPVYYQPKVGDCFYYDWDQAMFKNISDKPTDCQSLHTAETYKVQTWDSPINVYQDTDENILNVVRNICLPMSYKPSSSITQNYFTYSFPSEVQWNQGNKWVRCDGVILDRSGKVPRLVAWQGEPPIRQDIPATCTVESAKSNAWYRTIDEERYVERHMGFYVRNSSPDRDATQVLITATLRFSDGTSGTELFEISRIPAGQLVGVGKDFESSDIDGWSYKINCIDSPRGATGKLIELNASVVKQSGTDRYGLTYMATGINSYPNVIRCKNDNYSCMVYVLYFDNLGGIVGGNTIFITGPIYPNQTFTAEGYIYYPKSWHPEKISSVKMWVQEPQS